MTHKKFCECGCGELINAFDSWGFPRRFKLEHINRGRKVTEIARKNLSISHMNHPGWLTGKKRSEESRRRQSQTRTGKHYGPMSEETKRKIGLKHKGKTISLEMRQKLSKYTGRIPWHKGRTGVYSEETRWRMGTSCRGKFGRGAGKKRSEATKQKNRLARAKQVFPFRDSTSETTIQNKLSELGINFRKHRSFKIRKSFHPVDLFISPNVCIYRAIKRN